MVTEGVVTQGRQNVDQWVISYLVHYKQDGEGSFQTVLDENDQPKVIFVFVLVQNFKLFICIIFKVGCFKIINKLLARVLSKMKLSLNNFILFCQNFDGNADRSTPVINRFDEDIRARYFRIEVVAFHGHPCMRFDFIMC